MMDQGLKNLDLHLADQSQPKHELLKQYFVAEMTAGRLRPGEALPSENRLADVLRVARTTVRQTLAALERDGLICRVRGKGTFVDQDAQQRLERGLEVFALIVPATRTGYYPSLLQGFETAAGRMHKQMLVCCTDNSPEKQGNIVVQLLDKEVSGVAIVPTPRESTPAYQIRQLHKHGIPVVFCHRGVNGVRAPLLAIPFREVGRKAGRAFVEHGHRRVGFIANQRSDAALGYEAGLREAMRASGGELPEEFVFFCDPDCRSVAQREEAILPVLERFCHSGDRPTGIMAGFDGEAELIYLLLGQLGLRVPQDISVVGFGGTWRERGMLRRLTSVAVDEAELGRRAVQMLDEMRNGSRPLEDTERVVMPLSLATGQTLGPAPAQAEQGSQSLGFQN